jgi:hypothetical protein
MSFINPYIKVN